jgi:uncharacterized protein (UPF0333 family)
MALFALAYVKSLLGRVVSEERAQDTFEYVLVVGVIVVLAIGAVATPIGTTAINAVVTGACTAISTLPNMTVTC